MTITSRVQQELVQAVPQADKAVRRTLKKNSRAMKERAAARVDKAVAAVGTGQNKGKAWTRQEHERFLVALDVFPSGPWRAIADYVGTKDSRQTMTHAQKYRQKHERRQRGLRNASKGKRRAKKQPHATESASPDCATDDADEPMDAQDDAHTQTQPEPEADASGGFTALLEAPPSLALTKQLSDSPRSVDGGATTMASLDPFAPVVAADSAFAFSFPLDAGTDWADLKTDSSNSLMEIFADFEPVGGAAWPDMWSTNSLEEMALPGAQFDLFSDNFAAV